MWIATLFETLNRYRRFRASLREIATLDDHALRDIGLNRSELVGKAWEAAHR